MSPSPSPPDPAEDLRRIEEALEAGGPPAAIEALCRALERDRKYTQLFEAQLIASRAALGLPLISIGALDHLGEEVLRPHEEAIARACRKVGGLLLEEGDLAAAWPYFRALGENGPMARALERVEPGTKRKDLEELIDLAFHQGVHPVQGLRLILASAGICAAITAMERSSPAHRPAQSECASLLVRHLYEELVRSVRWDLARRFPSPGAPPESGPPPGPAVPSAPGTLAGLIADRPYLFENAAYHVDPSHLWAVMRFSAAIERGRPEIELAIELAGYGGRLAPMYHYQSEAPFERFYEDHAIYLRGRRGLAAEGARDLATENGAPGDDALAASHFRDKARAARARGEDRYPVGSVVEILERLGRSREAIELYLEMEPEAPLLAGASPESTLGVLCQRAGEFERLRDLSRRRGDLLGFTAGLLQSRRPPGGASGPS